MKSPIKIVDQFAQEIKISDVPSEKSGEIVIEIAWVTAPYYGVAFMLWVQADLILDGIRGQLDYSITRSEFWRDCLLIGLFWLIGGAIIGFLIGLLHGCLISLIYHKSSEAASQPTLFKIVVYLINLSIPTTFFLILIFDMLKTNYFHSIDSLSLAYMAFAAAAFYTSRRFWRWWNQSDTVTPNA